MSYRLIPDRMANPVTPLTYDGVDFRAVKGDADGHLQVDVVSRASETKEYIWWENYIAAGATETLVGETAGRGRIVHLMLYVDGVSGNAKYTNFRIYIDGEEKGVLSVDRTYTAVGRRIASLNRIGCTQFDTTYDIYAGYWSFDICFDSSIRIAVTNGDGANAVYVTAYALIQFET